MDLMPLLLKVNFNLAVLGFEEVIVAIDVQYVVALGAFFLKDFLFQGNAVGTYGPVESFKVALGKFLHPNMLVLVQVQPDGVLLRDFVGRHLVFANLKILAFCAHLKGKAELERLLHPGGISQSAVAGQVKVGFGRGADQQ